THPATRERLFETLFSEGLRFDGPGLVRHTDGRAAPTRARVGRISGERIRSVRRRMGVTVAEMAQMGGCSERYVRVLEGLWHAHNAPPLILYPVICGLEARGCMFSRKGDVVFTSTVQCSGIDTPAPTKAAAQ